MTDAQRQRLMQGQQLGSRYALTAPDRIPMGLSGAQLGHRAGSSLEFKEHREYQLGDDIRRIDWQAYARTDRLHVKQYREEVNPHVDLLIDGSRSMALAGTAKADATLALSAALVTAAANTGYSHAAWTTTAGCKPIDNGRGEAMTWGDIAFASTEALDESILRLPPAWRAQSIRVLISDLLFLGDPLSILQPIAANASMVVVVQVLAQVDADPPQRGSLRLSDCETHELREVFIDAVAQQRYRAALAGHLEQWHRAAVQVGAVMTTFIAERFITTQDLEPLVAAEVLKVA